MQPARSSFGGAIDLSASTDPRWKELERRIEGGAVHPAASSREPEPQVLLHGELGEDAPSLRHERDPGSRDVLGIAPDDRRAREPNVAAGGGVVVDGHGHLNAVALGEHAHDPSPELELDAPVDGGTGKSERGRIRVREA